METTAVCTDASGNIDDAASTGLGMLPSNGTGVQIYGNGPVPAACTIGAAA